jgi:PAS domain-containing protein
MRPPLSIFVLLVVALLACAALYAWSPAVALFSLGSAAAGFLAARLARPTPADDGAQELSAARPSEALTPNVAAAVASGEVPAAALLDVTMDSMREGVVVIDSAMRLVALNNSARDIFRSDGADSLGARRLSDLTNNPSIYSAFAAAVARGARAEVKVETARGTD